jgi:hypothetical protein
MIDMLSEGLATKQLSFHLSPGEMKPTTYPQTNIAAICMQLAFFRLGKKHTPIAAAW